MFGSSWNFLLILHLFEHELTPTMGIGDITWDERYEDSVGLIVVKNHRTK
jgi:hypothetical protein